MAEAPSRRYRSPKEQSDRCGGSPSLAIIYDWLRSGELPHLKIGRLTRIADDDFDAALNARRRVGIDPVASARARAMRAKRTTGQRKPKAAADAPAE